MGFVVGKPTECLFGCQLTDQERVEKRMRRKKTRMSKMGKWDSLATVGSVILSPWVELKRGQMSKQPLQEQHG